MKNYQETRFPELFQRLSQSSFRSRFRLKEKDIEYIQKKGSRVIREHGEEFVAKRLAPAEILNDGKQTPMRGHPVFVAQHATACCCRGCLAKWHHIPPGVRLTKEQQEYVVEVLMEWIRRQLDAKGVEVSQEPQDLSEVLNEKTAENGAHTADRKETGLCGSSSAKTQEYEQLRLPFL